MGYGRSKSIVIMLSVLIVVCVLVAFLNSARLQSNLIAGWTMVALIILLIIITDVLIIKAQEPKQYHCASMLLKTTMAVGALTILLI